MAQPGEKNISAFISPGVAGEFKSQCEERKYFKGTALEGALRAWLLLDRNTQRDYIEGKVKPESSVASENEIYADLAKLAEDFRAVDEKIRRSESAKQKKDALHKRDTG